MTNRFNIAAVCFLSLVVILGAWVWSDIAYYQDEFVFRILNGRYLQDNGVPMGIYSLCESWFTSIPWFLHPSAAALSWWYATVDVVMARFFATIASIFFIFAIVWKNTDKLSSLLICSVFVGVASSTLGYTRPEYLHLLNLAICLFSWRYAQIEKRRRLVCFILATLTLFSFLTSIYAHSQGVLFLPLNILAIYTLYPHRIRASVMVSVLLITASAIAWQNKQEAMACNQVPNIAYDISTHTHPISQLPSVIFSEKIINQTQIYVDRFTYHKKYQSYFLPELAPNALGQVLSPLIKICILGTLFISIVVSLKYAYSLTHNIFTFKKNHAQLKQAAEHQLLVLFLLAPSLLLFLVNVDQNFYRNFFIHLLLTAGITIALQGREEKNKLRLPFIVSITFVCFVAAASVVHNYLFIKPLLPQQEIVYGAKWGDVKKTYKLPNACGLDLEKGRVLVDALAYETIKKSPYLYPIEYVFVQARKTNMPPKEVVKRMNMQGMVRVCGDSSTESLCCHAPPKKVD